MKINVTDEFKTICEDIMRRNMSDDDWAEIESDDMFQTNSYCGGYDADEEAFCFSYYDENDDEYWFQLNLKEISNVVTGELTTVEARPAE